MAKTQLGVEGKKRETQVQHRNYRKSVGKTSEETSLPVQ